MITSIWIFMRINNTKRVLSLSISYYKIIACSFHEIGKLGENGKIAPQAHMPAYLYI